MRYLDKKIFILILTLILCVAFCKDACAKTTIVTDKTRCIIRVILHKEFYVRSPQSMDQEIRQIQKWMADALKILHPTEAWGERLDSWWAGAAGQAKAQRTLDYCMKRLREISARQQRQVAQWQARLTDADIANRVDAFRRSIENVWNSPYPGDSPPRYTYKCCLVRFMVLTKIRKETDPPTPGFDQIAIMLNPDFRSNIGGREGDYDSDGFTNEPFEHDMRGEWNYHDVWPTPDAVPSHEAGHEMGLADEYTDTPTPGGGVTSTPKTGHANDNMAGRTGTPVSWSDPANPMSLIDNIATILIKRDVKCPPSCCSRYVSPPVWIRPHGDYTPAGPMSPTPLPEDTSGWRHVPKKEVTDASTGEKLPEGDVVVIPSDDSATPVTDDTYTLPKTGDTVIVSAPCHKKEEYVVGKDSVPEKLSLEPKPLRYVTNKGDKVALQNIQNDLGRQGITYDPNDVKINDVVGMSEVVIPKYNAGKTCPNDLQYPEGDPEKDGYYEPPIDRTGQAGSGDFPQDPFYHSKSSWGQNYDDQWALKHIGFNIDSDVDKELLWPNAAYPVTVAVIDSGVDFDHPELKGQEWINETEIPANGKDDDNNGFVDDVNGWNFKDNNNNITDKCGHGTLAAGIIAANTDNGIGIAGINPKAKIMALKVTDFNNKGNSIDLAKAIVYAANNGAKVINISIGGPGVSQVEKKAVEYANKKGALIVACAGNDDVNIDNYSSSAYKDVLVVGSTNLNDQKAPFSNWGKNISVSAPGTDILSLRAGGTDFLIFANKNYKRGFAIIGADKKYYRASGSSFSAPFVSGLASLILAKNNSLKNSQVANMIIYSAKDIDVEGRDQNSGYGMIDAKAALKADPNFFLAVDISQIKADKSGNDRILKIIGTVSSDDLKEARIEAGIVANPAQWKLLAGPIKTQVTNSEITSVSAQELAGSKKWTIRVIVEHKNGQTRQVRHLLILK